MNRNTIEKTNPALIDSVGLKNLFRITQLDITETSNEFYRFKAEIYNKHTLLSVSWISEIKPDALRRGDVVSVIWLTRKVFRSGTNIILGLTKIIQLQEDDCVLSTVPDSWIRNPTIFIDLANIIQSLNKELQSLIQHILLQPDVLYRFLTAPFQLRGFYSHLGGNLQKTVLGVREALLTNHQQVNFDSKLYLAALVLIGIGRNKQFKLDKPNKVFRKAKYPDPNIEAMNLIIETAARCDIDNKNLLALLRVLNNMQPDIVI